MVEEPFISAPLDKNRTEFKNNIEMKLKMVAYLVIESRRSRNMREDGGNTMLPELVTPNSGATATSSSGDSEPTSSSDDSSAAPRCETETGRT